MQLRGQSNAGPFFHSLEIRMYPINVQLPAPAIGFAVANDEQEHKDLSAAGYLPAFVEAEEIDPDGRTVESVRAELDAAGIPYKKTFGLTKLIALLPE
jgi:hypothetical protein